MWKFRFILLILFDGTYIARVNLISVNGKYGLEIPLTLISVYFGDNYIAL